MKKFNKYKIVNRVAVALLFLFALVQEPLEAQSGSISLPENPGESIVLNCDRSIYGVREKISYSATYLGPGGSEGPAWSRVLYVELIQNNGSKLAASKVEIVDNRAVGEIWVPKNIPSGVYYLRAYTKWLRNYGPTAYAYIPLRILNPYSKEVLAPSSSIDSIQLQECPSAKLIEGIVFSGLKEVYEGREYAEIEIQLTGSLSPGTYSLSIAKTESLSSINYKVDEKNNAEEEHGAIDFLPELGGLSLRGKIVESESGLPAANRRLRLSTYEKPFFFAELTSGADGSFLFTLPQSSGKQEFHLAEAVDSLQGHKIQLVPEFCIEPVLLPYIPLRIDTSEQEIVKELLVNLQLQERYGAIVDQENSQLDYSTSFYGSGTTTTNVGDYIELSDLRECINEIIPQVSIRSSSHGEHLSILGPACLDIYPPLVLIDNVPVPNNEELLSIPSNRIRSIEVLNEAYMVGEFRYSGIINIFSRQRDMAGISLNGEHSFFEFQLLDNKIDTDKYRISSPGLDLADIRNQLFWEPEIEFTDQASFRFAFTTSDAPGRYQLTLRRIDQENSLSTYKKAHFSVK